MRKLLIFFAACAMVASPALAKVHVKPEADANGMVVNSVAAPSTIGTCRLKTLKRQPRKRPVRPAVQADTHGTVTTNSVTDVTTNSMK
jgi:hypothetical protein